MKHNKLYDYYHPMAGIITVCMAPNTVWDWAHVLLDIRKNVCERKTLIIYPPFGIEQILVIYMRLVG